MATDASTTTSTTTAAPDDATAPDTLLHITRAGERWDQIANRYYGDPFAYEAIIRANPMVAITPILPAGLTLLVPLPDDTAAQIPGADLPPWKQ